MIKGVKSQKVSQVERPSVNYRKIEALNQSMLALFDSDPVQFFKEFKLGEPRKPKESAAIIIGDLTHLFLLECNCDEDIFLSKFDEKFALMEGEKGSGQVFNLADELFLITVRDTVDGEVKTTFMDRFTEAYNIVTIRDKKYKKAKSDSGFKSVSEVMEDFDKNGRSYFDLKLANVGKTVVPKSLVDKAKFVANGLKSDSFTKSIFIDNLDEYLPHFPVEWSYMIDENRHIPCKSEIDLLKIDHQKQEIWIYDLKTNYDNESFRYSYIKNYYYIQCAFYMLAVKSWAIEKGFASYKIHNMQFVVGDTSSNNRRPLVYQTSDEDWKAGLHGFSLNGNYYRGVIELLQEIVWCEENSIWNCSKESYDNNGKMKLNITYE